MKDFLFIYLLIGALNIGIYYMYHDKLFFISTNIYQRLTIATWVKNFFFSFMPVLNVYYLTEQVFMAWSYANKEKEFDNLLRKIEEKKFIDSLNSRENKKPRVQVMNCVCDYAIYVNGKLEHNLILNSKKNAELIKIILEADYEHRSF